MYSTEIEVITNMTPQVIDQIISLCDAVPEFESNYPRAEFESRLGQAQSLLLVARVEGEIAGFKLGYANNNEIFYSWLGAIFTDFRGLGLAKSMLNKQEAWACQRGYQHMEVKTRNCFPAMLSLLIQHKYQIISCTADEKSSAQNKLLLRKSLA